MQSKAYSEGGKGAIEPIDIDKDVIFGLLRNQRRRRCLEYLRKNGSQATIAEIADHIAAMENDTTIRQLDSQQRKRVYVGLYQCHIPKLDDADVIENSRGEIEIGPNADQLFDYLDMADDDDGSSGLRARFADLF